MLTQAGRHIRVNTNLGEDKIFLESFEGEERVSDLFRFELGILTNDPGFSMDTLLPDISKQLLGKIAEGLKPEAIHVIIAEDGTFAYR